jgi:probable rRNA maturation factor
VAGGEWPDGIDWPGLAAASVAAALAETPHGGLAARGFDVEVGVRLTDNAEVQGLNRQFRNKDKPTNVLSFPMLDAVLLGSLANSDDGEVLLGDIVLAGETCRAEAEARDWPLADHVQHLIVHGTLHLLGYDHETGEMAADAMEALERNICARLGLGDPYPA